jgi:hypothetical protein
MEAKKKLEREARAYVEKALAQAGKRPSKRNVSRAVRKIVENFEGISYGEDSSETRNAHGSSEALDLR